MGVNSLPKTITRQRCDCDLNPGPSAPESSTLTTRLPSHPRSELARIICEQQCANGSLCDVNVSVGLRVFRTRVEFSSFDVNEALDEYKIILLHHFIKMV